MTLEEWQAWTVRTWFEPEEAEEFEATKDLLVATFWAHTALGQGVDLTVPGAFERFKRDLDAGRVPYGLTSGLDHRSSRRKCSLTSGYQAPSLPDQPTR
ncbi:hypothetical protein ABGB14_22785 [Nonomuraea sp. B10E15]|uniref:hypothetical protein n=1 Tax=Nonomuraea sp. B10E15 TaxID=3153560 RepID=UPI00325F073F